MRLGRRGRTPQPSTETVGCVVITYNKGRSDPNNIATVRKTDFDRLVNVINAYQQLVDLRAQKMTHPNEQVRSDARELLGLARPKPQPIEHRPFPLQTYTVAGGRRRHPGRLRLGRVITLSPWLMRSAELALQSQALPPVES